jgi:hypothetical protein
MSYVFILDSNDYPAIEGFKNVEAYINDYYKIVKKLIPLSYDHEIKIFCDEDSTCLFTDLPVSSIQIRENKKLLSYFEVEDILINCKDITDTKDQLRDFIRIAYPKVWVSVVNNLNTRFI